MALPFFTSTYSQLPRCPHCGETAEIGILSMETLGRRYRVELHGRRRDFCVAPNGPIWMEQQEIEQRIVQAMNELSQMAHPSPSYSGATIVTSSMTMGWPHVSMAPYEETVFSGHRESELRSRIQELEQKLAELTPKPKCEAAGGPRKLIL